MQDYRRGHYENDERRSRGRQTYDRQGDTPRYRQDFSDQRFRGRDDRSYSDRYRGENERSWRDQGDGFAESRERYDDESQFAPMEPEPSEYSSRFSGFNDDYDRRYNRGFDRPEPERGRHQTQAVGGQQWSWGDRFGWNRGQQSYAGKGPKNYQRSDDRIREEISDRLTDDPRIDASDLIVDVQSCEVTLSGTVTDRDQKRRAEDLAESISGVKEVTNNIRLARQAESADQSSRSGILGVGPSGSKSKPTVGV
jgi:hypothetical protein